MPLVKFFRMRKIISRSLPGEFHGLYSPWGCKEMDTTEQLSLPLTKEMTTSGLLTVKSIQALPARGLNASS